MLRDASRRRDVFAGAPAVWPETLFLMWTNLCRMYVFFSKRDLSIESIWNYDKVLPKFKYVSSSGQFFGNFLERGSGIFYNTVLLAQYVAQWSL
jgi:hypothetical protein